MKNTRTRMLMDWIGQLLVACLVITLLLSFRRTFTSEQAALIKFGMTQQQVESLLGKPNPLAGYAFAPVQVARDNGLFVDDMIFIPNHYPLGPGLTRYTLHSRQEECWTDTSQEHYNWRCSFWLGEEYSIVVFYSPTYHAEKVYALRTTVTHGDWWVHLKWKVQEWLR